MKRIHAFDIAIIGVALGAMSIGGCSSESSGGSGSSNLAPSGLPTAPVVIKGERFVMELALTEPHRIQGLSGRPEIDPKGGMLFVFPTSARREFVMRECPAPIDIAFLDSSGRVVAVHQMTPEDPRREGESDMEYEFRLKRYPSRFPVQFAVETAGGRLAALGLQEGDKVMFDVEGLKRRAQ
jgi:uncharacterized membrane protein (UPF0127 family)